MRWFLAGLALLAAAAWMPAVSAEGPVNGTLLDIDDSNFPEVRVVLTLVDASGRPITGLTPGAFRVEESGARATVARVDENAGERIGLGIILAMDTSGSMYDQPLAEARTAAASFVRALHAADSVAVVSFASDVVVRSGMTSDRDSTIRSLEGLTAFGDTSLNDAVIRSIDLARESSLPRKAVVILTDGGIGVERSRASREEALSAASETGIPVYTIGLGKDIDRQFLGEIAGSSGGAFLEAPTPAAISSLYEQLGGLFRSQYVLTLDSPARADLADRNLRITVNAAAGSAELRSDYTSRRTILPATPVPVVEAPVASPAPAPEDGMSVFGFLAAVAAVMAALGAGGLAFRWQRERRTAAAIASLQRRALVTDGPPTAEGAAGVEPGIALAIDGPGGHRSLVAGNEPMTIGSGDTCQLRLDDDSGRVATEHARVWSNHGSLVFHQLSAEWPSLLRGDPISWVSLRRGDEVQIGPYRLRVEPAVTG
jgi:VWFA-related protein